jgi:hypothetical protein
MTEGLGFLGVRGDRDDSIWFNSAAGGERDKVVG